MTIGPEHRSDKYSAADREKMAKAGQAMEGGQYPIMDADDLSNAISLVGNGSASTASVKAFIVKRATALGLTDKLPDDWTSGANRNRRKSSETRHREVRFLDRNVEIRQTEEDDDGKVTLRGMVIRYGVPYSVRDEYGTFSETIERGAAASVLQQSPDVRFLFNHDGMPLARTANGSLTLRDLPEGVEVEARLDPEMPSAKDVIRAVSSGLISQMSVGMVVGSDTWSDTLDTRSISRLSSIPDVSAVTYPASPTTSIEAVQRSLATNPKLRSQLLADALPSARLDHIAAEVRAGKVLSSASASVLVGMAQQMHDLLASGGSDFSHTAPDDVAVDADDDQTVSDDDTPETVYMEDGTEDDGSEMDPDVRAELVELELRQMIAEQEAIELVAL